MSKEANNMIEIPKNDDFPASKQEMLHYLCNMQCNLIAPGRMWSPRQDGSDRKIEDFILEHGSFYRRKVLPGVHMGETKDEPGVFKPGVPQHCYRNSLLLVLADARLTYVEGYAFTDAGYYYNYGPTPHAWAVNADNEVIDVTWPDPGFAYCGVPFRGEWLMDLVIKCYGGTFGRWASIYHRFGTALLGDLGNNPEIWKGSPGTVTNKSANHDWLFLRTFPFYFQLFELAEQGWHGKAAKLLPLLRKMAQRGGNVVPDGAETRQTPQKLVRLMKRLAPEFERAGLVVENDRRHCWSIRRTATLEPGKSNWTAPIDPLSIMGKAAAPKNNDLRQHSLLSSQSGDAGRITKKQSRRRWVPPQPVYLSSDMLLRR